MNILLKFSGEFFTVKDDITQECIVLLNSIYESEMKSGYIVVGGGNRVRGKESSLNRNTSDKLGVLSTVFNAFILKDFLLRMGKKAEVFSPFSDFGVKYSPEIAMSYFYQDCFVILAGGLGTVGYVSTDLTAVVRALELNVDGFLKITKVDGVYDKNPSLFGAKILPFVSYQEVLDKKLEVMDLGAIAVAAENQLPIGVCSVDSCLSFFNGEKVGSIIGYDWRECISSDADKN